MTESPGMSVEQLIRQLQQCLDEGKNKPTDEVRFLSASPPCYKGMDYILTAQAPNTLTLCYDDGHF